MKITLFTSNKTRHNYLIDLLSTISEELYVVQECETIFPGKIAGHYEKSKKIREYFVKVEEAESKVFGKSYINNLKKNIKILPLVFGDLNKCSIKFLSDFLKSDLYIVFGSSYIKHELIDFLVEKKAINIHMGVSPYYKGTDCNFWAIFDDNPHLVGATIHFLSKGIDDGPILYHAMSNIRINPFEYTMSTVQSAFFSLVDKIKNKSIFKTNAFIQDNKKMIKYSKKNEFNDKVVKEFFSKEINLNSKKFDKSLLINPYFFNN